MIRRTLLPAEIEEYVSCQLTKETEFQKRLRAQTATLANAGMQLGSDQAAFLAWLVELTGAKRAIEIGTFTGLSALTVATALPPDGKLIACEISEEWLALAKNTWQEAGVAGKIDLRIGSALKTLAVLGEEFGAASFDFAFIDADKTGYDDYYEACLRLVKPGGVIALDNVLRRGAVLEPASKDEGTQVLQRLNTKIRDDARVSAVTLTIGDGVTVVRKR
jgi:predicted O-methyltransferase YrrM